MKYLNGLAVSVSVVFFNIGCATNAVTNQDRHIYSINCDDVESYASVFGDEKIVAKFVNSRDEIVDMYWINYEGDEVFKGSISPGEAWGQNTYLTHPWVVRNKSGLCVAAYNSGSRKSSASVVIR